MRNTETHQHNSFMTTYNTKCSKTDDDEVIPMCQPTYEGVRQSKAIFSHRHCVKHLSTFSVLNFQELV